MPDRHPSKTEKCRGGQRVVCVCAGAGGKSLRIVGPNWKGQQVGYLAIRRACRAPGGLWRGMTGSASPEASGGAAGRGCGRRGRRRPCRTCTSGPGLRLAAPPRSVGRPPRSAGRPKQSVCAGTGGGGVMRKLTLSPTDFLHLKLPVCTLCLSPFHCPFLPPALSRPPSPSLPPSLPLPLPLSSNPVRACSAMRTKPLRPSTTTESTPFSVPNSSCARAPVGVCTSACACCGS